MDRQTPLELAARSCAVTRVLADDGQRLRPALREEVRRCAEQ